MIASNLLSSHADGVTTKMRLILAIEIADTIEAGKMFFKKSSALDIAGIVWTNFRRLANPIRPFLGLTNSTTFQLQGVYSDGYAPHQCH